MGNRAGGGLGSAGSGGKGSLVGTYLAEQTSENNISLTNIWTSKQDEFQDVAAELSATRKKKPRERSRGGALASDAGLSALSEISMDPLLVAGGTPQPNTHSPSRRVSTAEPKQKPRGQKLAKVSPKPGPKAAKSQRSVSFVGDDAGSPNGKSTASSVTAIALKHSGSSLSKGRSPAPHESKDVDEVFSRLYSSRGRTLRSPLVDTVLQKDEELLTQMAEHDAPVEFVASLYSPQESLSQRSRCSRTHATHKELFDDVLHRSTCSSSPGGSIMSSHQGSRELSLQQLGKKRPASVVKQISDISVLPEDPVKAFFEAEKKAREEMAIVKQGKHGRVAKTATVESDHTGGGSTNRSSRIGRPSLITRALTWSRENERRDDEDYSPRSPSSPGNRSNRSGSSFQRKSERTSANSWDSLVDIVLSAQRITPEQREACEHMRLFIFGKIGNEDAESVRKTGRQSTAARERDRIFCEPIGKKEEVIQLYKVWCRLDDDKSGRVDFNEFRAHVKREKTMAKDRSTGGPNYACADKALKALLAKKSSFVLEDILRVCWPMASYENIAKMREWVKDLQKEQRVATPQVLPQHELEELIESFMYFDADGSGTVTLKELTESGMFDGKDAVRFLSEWDEDGNGDMSMYEFCEMMCRPGYRAYPQAKVASDPEGNRIVYDEYLGWRPAPERTSRIHAM